MSAASEFMSRALALAKHGLYSTQPNPRVGCVIVRQGVIVGEGWHARAGGPHAEVLALRAAGEAAHGADVYLTLEPCAHFGRTGPCVDALIASGVRSVTAAMQDPDPRVAGAGFARLRQAGIEVEIGLLGDEAMALNRGFVSRIVRGRPWTTLKLAASLDGRTAAASGESQWITGSAARADVHRLRAQAGAVLASSATVLADDPQLNVREFSGDPAVGLRQPDRIVLDGSGRVPRTAKVWIDDGVRRLRIVGESVPQEEVPAGVETLAVQSPGQGGLSLPKVLTLLAEREINEILVECGPRLAGALLSASLVDELIVYLAPMLLGDTARPLAHLPELRRLEQKLDLHIVDLCLIGGDVRVTAQSRIH